MYTAYYAPMIPEGKSSPTKEGFPSEKSAWKHVFQWMCKGCRDERCRALRLKRAGGDPDSDLGPNSDSDTHSPSEYPACSCEWFVLKTDDLDGCESFGDVLEASGWNEVIYRRPEDGETP